MSVERLHGLLAGSRWPRCTALGSSLVLLVLGCEADRPDDVHELTPLKQASSPADTRATEAVAQPPSRSAASNAAQAKPKGTSSADAAMDSHAMDSPTNADASARAPAADASAADAAEEDEATSPPSAEPGDPAPSDPTAEWAPDCEQRYVLRAHGASMPGDTSKFSVEPGAQHLALFYFARPWSESTDVQLLEVRARLDNAAIVHHWAIYSVDNPAVRDGEVQSGGDLFYVPLHDGSKPLHASGTGAPDLRMPDGVGLRMPSGPDVALALELHYFNPTDAVAADASAVEICITSKKRPQEASMHVLGRLTFNLPAHTRTDVSSTCRPVDSQAEIHLLSITPHMHLLGVRSSWTLDRANGERVDLLDVPYTFREQRTYALPADGSGSEVVLSPGDTLTTTCVFDNTSDAAVVSGDRTENEMCQPMVMAWPAGALSNGVLSMGLPGVAPLDCVEL